MAPVPILSIQVHHKRGGPSIQHINFLKAVDPSRFAMHVLVVQSHEMREQYDQVAASVITMPHMPTIPRSKSPLSIARYFAQTRTMARQIAQVAKDVDARIIHSFSEAFPAPLLAAQQLNLPSMVHILGMSIFQPRWVGKIWTRYFLNRATRIVGCQQLIADEVRRTGVAPEKILVIYNCIDPGTVREQAQTDRPHDLSGDGLKVGMVAEMDRRKGHLNFVTAAAHVTQQLPDVTFYCMGNTSGNDLYLSEIKAKIAEHDLSDRVHLVGRVDNMGAWIQAMDVYCIPSLSEALSVAGLEAMALERPLVATRVGGNPEAVIDGQNGLICAAADPKDLADKLLTLLHNEPLRTQFGRNGRNRADELFSVESNAQKLQSVFEELNSRVGDNLPQGTEVT